MALSFTDAQIQNITGEMLDAPQALVTLDNSLSDVQDQRAEIDLKDKENKVFYDNFRGNVDAYHSELKYLNGDLKTNYDDQDLDDGARRLEGAAHFPTTAPNIWIKFQPKVIDSSNGSPVGVFAPMETDEISNVNAAQSLVENGFTDGSTETTSDGSYSGSGTLDVLDTVGFSNGDRIVIDAGGVSALATVIGSTAAGGFCTGENNPVKTTQIACEADSGVWTPTSPSLTVTHIAGNISIGTGARVRNYRPAFTNSERESSGSSYSPEVLQYFKDEMDARVADWETALDGQLTALNLNDDSANETEINQAITDVGGAKTSIDSWQASPDTGGGVGRFGDTALLIIATPLTNRGTQITNRITEVGIGLGSVAQAADGTFSGSGEYFNLFNWIDLRINVAGGSLSSYYGMGVAEDVFGQQIGQTTTKNSEHENNFLVKVFSSDGDGSSIVSIADATSLSIGNTVKIIADGQAVLTTTIIDIIGTNIELGLTVSTDYSVADRARLVKEI